ncbi:hypothetical protein ACFY1A_48345, partial [Streptomyces sp. NPDC001520]
PGTRGPPRPHPAARPATPPGPGWNPYTRIRNRNARYEAVTEARPPRRLDALTQDEATEQLRELNATSQAFEPLPDFIPLPEPSDDLTMPLDHRPNQPDDQHPDDQTGLRT